MNFFYDVQSYEEIKADVKARRPVLKASGHVVAGALLRRWCQVITLRGQLPILYFMNVFYEHVRNENCHKENAFC